MTSITLNKINFDDIGLSDIQALVDSSVPESYTLEYKEQLNLDNDKDKKEFLADISSFANYEGGDIIYGIVDDKKGNPKEIKGLPCDNVDALMRRIDSILLSGIDPRITYKLKVINTGDNGILLLFRVMKNMDAPHCVVYKNSTKYYSKSSNSKYQLNQTEIENAYKAKNLLQERIKSFMADRIHKIKSSDTPVTISPKGNIVLHFVPASAFLSDNEIDHQTLANKSGKLALLYWDDVWKDYVRDNYNSDGYLLFLNVNNKISYDYTKIFKNGIIEAIDGLMFDSKPYFFPNIEKGIPSLDLVKSTLEFFKEALSFYQSIGIKPPIRFHISLVNIKGYGLAVSEGLKIKNYISLGQNPPVATDNNITLPECTIYDFSIKPEYVLTPMFDKLWQHFGYQKCDIQIRNGVIVNV